MSQPTIPLRDWEVRALLAGATQLWRPFRKQPCQAPVRVDWTNDRTSNLWTDRQSLFRCPYGKPGDVVLGKEAWRYTVAGKRGWAVIQYRADKQARQVLCEDEGEGDAVAVGEVIPASAWISETRWRSAQTMPAWACRITRKLASVRVRMVQEADAEDVDAMGLPEGQWSHVDSMRKFEFAQLWDEWHGPGEWERNDWCWCLEFQP